jgi:hypothetical protein
MAIQKVGETQETACTDVRDPGSGSCRQLVPSQIALGDPALTQKLGEAHEMSVDSPVGSGIAGVGWIDQSAATAVPVLDAAAPAGVAPDPSTVRQAPASRVAKLSRNLVRLRCSAIT